MRNILFNDLTDFIDYCLNNRNFSGIQRVQHDMLKAMSIQGEYHIIPIAFRDRKIQIFTLKDMLEWSSISDLEKRREAILNASQAKQLAEESLDVTLPSRKAFLGFILSFFMVSDVLPLIITLL